MIFQVRSVDNVEYYVVVKYFGDFQCFFSLFVFKNKCGFRLQILNEEYKQVI